MRVFWTPHQDFEVARRQIEVQVEFADVVELLEGDRLQASVEGLDDPRRLGKYLLRFVMRLLTPRRPREWSLGRS